MTYPLRLLDPLIPCGEAEELHPVVIPDPERDGIDIAELETALMGFDAGCEG